MEKYITFSIGQLQFIDSFQFMTESLDNRAKNLSVDDLKITAEKCKAGMFDLLRKKGIYPYDYFNSMDRFAETCLPPRDKFYSQLTRHKITDEEYLHALNVWERGECKTLGDYHDVYLETDVLLLADVFEKFRTTSMTNYKLDPVSPENRHSRKIGTPNPFILGNLALPFHFSYRKIGIPVLYFNQIAQVSYTIHMQFIEWWC